MVCLKTPPLLPLTESSPVAFRAKNAKMIQVNYLQMMETKDWFRRQLGKRSEGGLEEKVVNDLVFPAHYFDFARLHLGWPPVLDIFGVAQTPFYPIWRPFYNDLELLC